MTGNKAKWPSTYGVLDRRIEVRFDANVSSGLPSRFEPEQTSVIGRTGDVITVNYLVGNESAHATVGQTSYNVSPPAVRTYFTKINCFCFTEQRRTRAKLNSRKTCAPRAAVEMETPTMTDAHPQPHLQHHLIEPSPWPIIGSVSIFILAVGIYNRHA
jgi:hypothetical protein